MRKSLVTVTVQLPPANESDFMTQIVAWLTGQKTQGKIEKATIETQEIDVATKVTI